MEFTEETMILALQKQLDKVLMESLYKINLSYDKKIDVYATALAHAIREIIEEHKDTPEIKAILEEQISKSMNTLFALSQMNLFCKRYEIDDLSKRTLN
jgi:hypothetical protein